MTSFLDFYGKISDRTTVKPLHVLRGNGKWPLSKGWLCNKGWCTIFTSWNHIETTITHVYVCLNFFIGHYLLFWTCICHRLFQNKAII